MIDTVAYTTHTATEESPFLLPSDDMFGEVETSLSFQKARGASAALTPTGYIPTANSKALKAVWHAAKRIERGDVIVSLPVGAGWLKDDHIKQLIGVCARITQPKALIMTGQFDPSADSKELPANLRRLMGEVEHMALMRTDLAGLDAMAHGALFAGIGGDSSMRHSVPAHERALSSGFNGPWHASVLLPDLMCFTKGNVIADRYANEDPPRCSCDVCDGRGLHRFDPLARMEAEDHNNLIWREWFFTMAARSPGTARQAWWRDKCAAAIDRYSLENQRLGLSSRGGFQVPKPLKAWASLPVLGH
ncbi:hypothetical protein OG948_17440 [Embleya sp. NBC_00888]|uniref:hypothetical protein n=1 Tax=Embleya sp. NBC_00888 TaxID=2975960 RepID=UPI003870981F|nr:hypothetical protein OG948_17440 [Embleya sp. NBC_00888]